VESIDTTLTQVELGVESTGKSASAVQQEVARRSTAVVELLKNRKVEKLETTGINLSPTYDYTGGRQVLTGYSATNRVRFQVPIPQAGILLDQAVQSGASRIDGLSLKPVIQPLPLHNNKPFVRQLKTLYNKHVPSLVHSILPKRR
jgi:uncharacterized protein YggE